MAEDIAPINGERFAAVGSNMHQSHKVVVFHLAIVLSLALALFFFGLGRRALVDPDEARYAEGAREMLEIGDWITPKFNYEDRLDKPILFYWFLMTAYKLIGVTEFAARLFPALFAVIGVVLTYLLGALMFSSRAGLFSAIILATSPLYFAVGRLTVTDMVLSVFILLALCCFSLVYFYKQRVFALPFFIALGLAMLTKGPVGIVLVFLIILVFLGLRRELGQLRNLRIGWGICVFLIVTLPWFLLLMARHEGLLRYYFYEQTLSRFFTEKYERSKFLFYYFFLVIPAFFPWIVLFVSASWRYWKKGWKDAISKRPQELIFWLWGVLPVLFFTMSQSKLATYILPAFPGLALFVGQWMDREIGNWSQMKRTRSLQVACALFCCAMVVVLIASTHYYGSEHQINMAGLLAAGALGFIFGLVGLLLSRHGKWLTTFWLLVAGMIVLELGTMPAVDSYLSDRRSLKTLCEEVRPKIDPNALIIRYEGDVPPSFVFYLRHRVIKVTNDKVLVHYNRLPGVVYVLTQHNDYDKVFRDSFSRHVLIAGNAEFFLVANRHPSLQ